MQESFNNESDKLQENPEWIRSDTGEQTKIEYDGIIEHGSKLLPNGMFGLEKRIADLEGEGWKIFRKGEQFVVLDRKRNRNDR